MRSRLVYPIFGLTLFAATPAFAGFDFELSSSEACEELTDQMIEWAAYQAVVTQYYRHYYSYGGRGGRDAPASEAAPAPRAMAETKTAQVTASGPTNYTKTNVQEAGVDEADVIKTDGKYIYTVRGRELLILKSWPVEEATIIGRLMLPENVTATQLFLRGDQLVILSRIHEQLEKPPRPDASDPYGWTSYYWNQRAYFYGTRISIVDIDNREKPIIDRNIDIEGWSNQARMVGSDLYVVSNGTVHIPPKLMRAAHERATYLTRNVRSWHDWQSVQRDQQRLQKSVARYLSDRFSKIDLDDAMPRTRASFYRGPMSSFSSMYSCDDIFVPPTAGAQLGILNLTHIDLRRAWDADHTGIFASGWTIYASTEALYAATPYYGWGWAWGWWNAGTNPEYNKSFIHKFGLKGKDGRPYYAGSGKVDGYLLNQFSMSEHRGDLRVVTTDMRWFTGQAGANQQANNLFVLRERGDRLEVIGSIRGLAPGERIYSARMFGDKGYMVTFRQTDPLFTLDLSNPERPRVAGELKINGFSSYIHPLGENHLLTIGQDADDDGRVQGVHIQVFDVSDASAPKRTHHHRLHFPGGWSWSAAQWDHHAFTYDPVSKTLAFPVQIYGRQNPSENFSGLVMFRVDSARGFEELGRITHTKLAQRLHRASCKNPSPQYQYYCNNNMHDWFWTSAYGSITRSIIMDEYVFTLSTAGIMVNELFDPAVERASVLFAPF